MVKYNGQMKELKKQPLKGYIECKQHKLDKKGKKPEKALCKHVVSLYLSGFSQVVIILGLRSYNRY